MHHHHHHHHLWQRKRNSKWKGLREGRRIRKVLRRPKKNPAEERERERESKAWEISPRHCWTTIVTHGRTVYHYNNTVSSARGGSPRTHTRHFRYRASPLDVRVGVKLRVGRDGRSFVRSCWRKSHQYAYIRNVHGVPNDDTHEPQLLFFPTDCVLFVSAGVRKHFLRSNYGLRLSPPSRTTTTTTSLFDS